MSHTKEQLDELVKQWSTERNLFDAEHGSTAEIQLLKLMEEFGETVGAVLKNKTPQFVDGIGDMQVVITNVKELFARHGLTAERTESSRILLAMMVDFGIAANAILSNSDATVFASSVESMQNNIEKLCEAQQICSVDAYAQAYDVIKNRKGKMINRNFVKEEDIQS